MFWQLAWLLFFFFFLRKSYQWAFLWSRLLHAHSTWLGRDRGLGLILEKSVTWRMRRDVVVLLTFKVELTFKTFCALCARKSKMIQELLCIILDTFLQTLSKIQGVIEKQRWDTSISTALYSLRTLMQDSFPPFSTSSYVPWFNTSVPFTMSNIWTKHQGYARFVKGKKRILI